LVAVGRRKLLVRIVCLLVLPAAQVVAVVDSPNKRRTLAVLVVEDSVGQLAKRLLVLLGQVVRALTVVTGVVTMLTLPEMSVVGVGVHHL